MKRTVGITAILVSIGAVLIGVAGLVYTPISDCSELGGSTGAESALLFGGVAALTWLWPVQRTAVWRGLTSVLFLVLAALALYFPTGLSDHQADVLSCVPVGR